MHGGDTVSAPGRLAPPQGVENVNPDSTSVSGFTPPGNTTDEEERLELMRRLEILDSKNEDRFSSITRLMCSVFDVPIAAVSLIDAERQWFKAAEGLGEVCQTGRDISFCGHTILPPVPQIFIVEDTLEDVRFAGNPLVKGPPYIRFYAGAPLVSSANGYRYGSLCVIDTRPHSKFSTEQYNLLAQFAELTVREIEKDKVALLQKMIREQRALSASASESIRDSDNNFRGLSSQLSIPATEPDLSGPWELSRTPEDFTEGIMLMDLTTESWQILYTNPAFSSILGVPADEALSQGFWDLFDPASETEPSKEPWRVALRANQPFSLTVSLQSIYRQTPKVIALDFKPVEAAQLGIVGVPATAFQEDGNFNLPNRRLYFGTVRPDCVQNATKRRPPSPQERMLSFSKVMPSAFTDVKLGPLIGRGAYGRVYRGTWHGNTVAVKVVEASKYSGDTDAASAVPSTGNPNASRNASGARGLFEAVLSSSLSHPNVVHTYQYAVRPLTEESHEVWLISEYCNKGPLLTAIERGAFLTQPAVHSGHPNLIAVLQTLQEIAAAMHYLHGHDIVHGDLTGGNVLLTSSEKDARGFTAKVVDFGLSRICGERGYLKTKTLGCAEYMPPELIRGGILTKASDVYAFGVITWELYLGRRAWEGLRPGQVLKLVANNERLQFPPQTPRRLRVLGEGCLAPDPTQRPTFTQILEEVNSILSDTMSILQQFVRASAAGV